MRLSWQLLILFPLLASAFRIRNSDTLFANHSYTAVADNVTSVHIGDGSVPGSIILTETRAFAIVLASDTTIVGAGGSLDVTNGGRVAAFTHGSFLSSADTNYGLGTLMVNIAKWCGQSDDPRVAFQSGRSELTDLSDSRFSFTAAPVELTDTDVINGELTKSNYDVIFAQSAHYSTAAEMAALRAFLEAGGGVVFYGTSWAFNYPNGFDYELEYPANVIIAGTGVNILGDIDWDYNNGPWLLPDEFPDPLVDNAGYAIEALEAHSTGVAELSTAEEKVATDAVMQALDDLMDVRANLTTFFDALDDLGASIKNTTAFAYPSRTNTFDTEADSMVSFLISLENEYALHLPADQLTAHPGHVDYPGAVPSGATPLADQVFTVRGTYEGLDTNLIYAGSGSDRWTSTALYLVAGTTMTVTIPASLTDEELSIRVGCHTDNLSSKTTLNRMPEITRSWSLTSETTVIGSAFGGLVYIVVPWGSQLDDFEMTISGAVRSLQYTHNVTTLEEWERQIGTSAGGGNFNTSLYPPWAELVSEKYVMTIQTSVLLTVTDPSSVTAYWDSVVDAEDFLLGYPNLTWRADVGRAERMVVDVQISAGWMHSGYPWMAYDSVSDEMVDVPHLFADGEWGPYHELGHNHQYRPFVVMDSTEVSCNFFSAYIQEAVNGNPSFGTESIGCEDEIREYLAAPDYEGTLAGDVWMHLNFYLLMKQAFGWRVIQEALSSYVDGSDNTDYSGYSSYEKVDPLLLKLSVATGHNLVNYSRAWDYPLTAAGASAINALGLPEWDYDATLRDMEIQINPPRECYTPVDERYTLVQYNDALLGNNTNMWHYSTYRGVLNTTITGRTCQRWDAQFPHEHSYGPESKQCRGTVDNNYCRTNGEDRPWCYTTDSSVRWEFCDLPVCDKMTLPRATDSEKCVTFSVTAGYRD